MACKLVVVLDALLFVLSFSINYIVAYAEDPDGASKGRCNAAQRG